MDRHNQGVVVAKLAFESIEIDQQGIVRIEEPTVSKVGSRSEAVPSRPRPGGREPRGPPKKDDARSSQRSCGRFWEREFLCFMSFS